MSPIARKLVHMMDEEQKNMKLIAVEDVMRSIRLLAGWGQYPEFIAEPGKVFDRMNDMTIEELHTEKESLEAIANEYVQSIHFKGNIKRILRDDEQDFED